MTRWWPCTSGPACRSRVQLHRHFCSSRVSFLWPGLPVRCVDAVTRLRWILCRMNRVLGQSRCLPVTECLFCQGVGMDKSDLGTTGLSQICHILTPAPAPVTRLTLGHRNPPRLCGDLSRSRWDDRGGCASRRLLRGKRNTHR